MRNYKHPIGSGPKLDKGHDRWIAWGFQFVGHEALGTMGRCADGAKVSHLSRDCKNIVNKLHRKGFSRRAGSKLVQYLLVALQRGDMIRVETTRDTASQRVANAVANSTANALRTVTMERILVVEDDHAVQKALRRLFESEGFEFDAGGGH